ncbi:MAG TPA: PhzF family phenazine biosynthesis isomerase [Jatrophihabitans sp.]|nr:PhzF family phenazine biosynthesis isomerase [Jatrophihabitans sp.]
MDVLRYSAFSRDPAGGNPAGVVLNAAWATDSEMSAVASEVGYSETAFLVPSGDGRADVRYFSPLAEVPFCGHATIASAVAFAERHGPGTLHLRTPVGPVQVTTSAADGVVTATLVSVPPRVDLLPAQDLGELLLHLRWSASDLDPELPPRVAYAGAFHPVVAVSSRARLAALDYDFDALGKLMAARGWTTVDLVWREAPLVFHARNPFPPGGVVEDPATGAAAAAFGGYLRALGLVDLPAQLVIHQGADMGRPGLITVDVAEDPGSGIAVTGTAVLIG